MTRRVRLGSEDGFSLIEVMIAAMILVTGVFALVISMDVFRAQGSVEVARSAATHEAEQELEYLRSLGYRRLVLKAAPGAPSGANDPRSGVSGANYRPGPDAAYAPLVIDAAAEGALDQSRPWSAGRTSGIVYRFITQEAPGTAGCEQICPRRVSVGVTFLVGGKPHWVVMSTLVADPQAGTADEVSPPPAPTPAVCPCWSTLYLYDTLAENPDRVAPSTDHQLNQLSSGGQARKRTDYPLLMGTEAPPNPFADATSAPFEPTRYRYATDLEASDGLGQTYPGGTLIKESGGCNDEGDEKKSARWTTRPVTTDTVLTGDASAQIFTRLAGNLTGSGWLCFTFYDWTIDATGHVGSKTKLQSFGYNLNPWPTGEATKIETDIARYLGTGTTRTLLAGRALGVELTVDDDAAGTEAVFYDHPNLASSIQVSTTPRDPVRDDSMNDGLATPTPGRLRDERGSSMIAVVMVMTMLLVLTGTAFSVTQQLGRSVKETTKSQQAFAAASAGIDRALTRINTYKPAAADCVTDVVAAPVSGGWCAAAPTESLGRGASFTYRVSASPSGVAACGGVTLNNATGDRCLVATGTVDGLSRRVAARLAISTNSITFSQSTSVVGYKEVKIKKKGKIIGNISANHRFKIEKDGILTGTLSLGPKGKVQGWAGTPIRLPSPLVPNLPNFAIFDPVSGTVRDSATTNNNLTAASNPKVVYNATKRELTVPDGIVLTLPPGVYNFCKLTLGKGAKISVVKPQAGAAVPLDAVRLFIDGRERAGSRCTSDGELDSRTGASFVNGSNDPRALQIFAWGKRTKLKVGNAQDFAGIIYAPRSSVKFNATGKFTGGVAGQRVEVHKDMQVINSNLLSTWTSPMSEITQVVSWRQCLKGGLPADPYDRCPTA